MNDSAASCRECGTKIQYADDGKANLTAMGVLHLSYSPKEGKGESYWLCLAHAEEPQSDA